MNIIGLMVPKFVTLLTILISSIDKSNKIVLAIIWLIKYVVDYDVARPGHSGIIYTLTQSIGFEVGELLVAFLQFILSAFFLIATILMKAWIPFVPGVVGVLVHIRSLVCCIKDIIVNNK